MFALNSKLTFKLTTLKFIRLWNGFFSSPLNFGSLIGKPMTPKDFIVPLVPLVPVFGIFFNSVNKYIKKYSRGKSGKFNVLIKYLPPYKRFKYLLSIIIKDIFFNKSKTLPLKLKLSLQSILSKNVNSFTLKFRLILYYLVFKLVKLPVYYAKRIR